MCLRMYRYLHKPMRGKVILQTNPKNDQERNIILTFMGNNVFLDIILVIMLKKDIGI